jgi:hypothetical protein
LSGGWFPRGNGTKFLTNRRRLDAHPGDVGFGRVALKTGCALYRGIRVAGFAEADDLARTLLSEKRTETAERQEYDRGEEAADHDVAINPASPSDQTVDFKGLSS